MNTNFPSFNNLHLLNTVCIESRSSSTLLGDFEHENNATHGINIDDRKYENIILHNQLASMHFQ
jgi:hypothetical protein